jgi:hypothetical protein
MLGDLSEQREERSVALRTSEQAIRPTQGEAEGAKYKLPPIRTLTLEESRTHFDETTRKLLAISGDTFIERWYAGRYADILDDPAHSDIMYLTLLGNIGRSR